VGAKAASLTIMCGGTEAAFERVKPLFEKMGKNITLVGGVGDGQTTKVANQIIVALNIAAVGEGARLRQQGRSPTRQGAPGADGVALRPAAFSRCMASGMIKRSFNPGFRIGLHQKDLNLRCKARAPGRLAAADGGLPRS
jgi:2-hydroxy-3-oxopropionate reductase